MNYFIIVFKNTHDAMKAEKELEEMQIELRIMPTPTAITQSCGICIRIEDKEIVNIIINDEIIQFKNIYGKEENGYYCIL